ncbi:MAG: phytoene desaturase [Bacteroidales bacterium]|nr:phytoene desaturase [Bacteroidales bacterium]
MNAEKSAIVIGTGIGGLTTAIYLAQNGYQVKIFEKNATPGGRCGQIIREGHRFDTGATILLMPEIYRRIFGTLGLDFDECCIRHPLPTLYKIHYDDGTELEFSTNQKHFQDQLERLEKGSYQKALLYIRSGYKFYELAIAKLLGRNFTDFFQFANLKNMLLLIQLKTYLRHQVYIKRFFKHPHLRTAFTFQNIYVGQNPLKAPALFAMIPAAELSEGSFFPQGGMFSITNKLVSVAQNLGVKIFFSQPVVKINTCKNRVTGITTSSGRTTDGGIVIANADLPYVYRDLLPDKRRSARINRLKFSCSAIVLHWALDKEYTGLQHHNVFISDQYRSNLKTIFNKQSLSAKPSFYIHAPVRSDPTAAPQGQDTLSVIIPCGHMGSKKIDWNILKENARMAVINRLKQQGFDDIQEHLKFEISYLPQTWKNVFNLSRGATFGSLAHNIFQMGYFRPHNRHPFYKNLYFTGGGTHPGNGVPLVLLSARLVSERILKEMNDL